MSKLQVTVCVITYNQRDLIGQCLRSVLEQQADADVHIVVGDDASDDGTSEIVAQLAIAHPGVITHLRRFPRMGAMANMRDLMGRTEADFIARLDGDDYWLPGKLRRQLHCLLEEPGCAAVYSNAITIDGSGRRVGTFNDVGDARLDLAALFRRGNFLNNSSILFRREGRRAWLDVEAPQLDYRTHLWHARHGYLLHLGEPLTAYRVNAAGSMVAGMNDRVRELYWDALLEAAAEVDDRDLAAGLTNFLRRVAFRSMRLRSWRLLREWAPRVIAVSPHGALHTLALTSLDIVRIGLRMAWGRLRGRGRVLYRR